MEESPPFDPLVASVTNDTQCHPEEAPRTEMVPRGTVLGRYVIIEPVGSGGMGDIYRAYDPELNRGVALKILSVRHQDPNKAQRAKTRLIREAQALAQLSHPNVVAVHDVGAVAEDVFIAMELVRGQTLDEWIRDDHCLPEILDVMTAAGRGLAAAHQAGLVHRDFKPANVIVGDDSRVRVLDFGLARAVETEDDPELGTVGRQESKEWDQGVETSSDGLDSSSSITPNLLLSPLTCAGGILGTPFYMSPEQHRGLAVDPRSDQFSFCVVLHEVLFGQRPFLARTMKELRREVFQQRDRLSVPDTNTPSWLHQIVLKGLNPKPSHRFGSMDELLGELVSDPLAAKAQRRRKQLLALMIFLLAVLPFGLWYWIFESGAVCTGAEKLRQAVWNDGIKAEVKQAFINTELAYAPDTLARVEKLLINYLSHWSSAYTQVCEATRVHGEQPAEIMLLRMACLDRHRTKVAALVQVFREADKRVVEKSIRAVASLAGFSNCDDREALQARIRPPADPDQNHQVDRLRDWLVRIEALEQAGKYREGVALAEKTVTQANKIDYLPAQVETLYWLGTLQEKSAQYKQAADNLKTCALLADQAQHDEIRAKALVRLLLVQGDHLSRFDDALNLNQWTEAAVKRLADREIESRWLNNLGNVLYKKGDYQQAFERYNQALNIRQKILGSDHPSVATSLSNIGLMFRATGDYDKALQHILKALVIDEKLLGPEHPSVAYYLNNLGNVYNSKGEYDKSMEYYQRALAIFENSLGSKHPNVAVILNNLGMLFLRNDDYQKTLDCYQRSLNIKKQVLGPTHPKVAVGLNNLGLVYWEKGDYTKALHYIHQSLTIKEKALGRDHPSVGDSLSNLGEVLLSQGDYKQALLYHRRALAIREKVLGSEHPLVAVSLSGLGSVLIAQGNPKKAMRHLERVVLICETQECEPGAQGTGIFGLAQALVLTGTHKSRAIRLAQQAQSLFEKSPSVPTKKVQQVESWLMKQAPAPPSVSDTKHPD